MPCVQVTQAIAVQYSEHAVAEKDRVVEAYRKVRIRNSFDNRFDGI